MNNIYSCREIEKRLLRDTHFIWLAGGEKPDFVTINRFRNRVYDNTQGRSARGSYDQSSGARRGSAEQYELGSARSRRCLLYTSRCV